MAYVTVKFTKAKNHVTIRDFYSKEVLVDWDTNESIKNINIAKNNEIKCIVYLDSNGFTAIQVDIRNYSGKSKPLADGDLVTFPFSDIGSELEQYQNLKDMFNAVIGFELKPPIEIDKKGKPSSQ